MLWHARLDLAMHRTLNFYKLSRLRDTIRTSTQPIMFWMRNKTKFMHDFTVPLLVENASLIFILLTVSCGLIAHKTWPNPTLFTKQIVRCFVLIFANGCSCV